MTHFPIPFQLLCFFQDAEPCCVLCVVFAFSVVNTQYKINLRKICIVLCHHCIHSFVHNVTGICVTRKQTSFMYRCYSFSSFFFSFFLPYSLSFIVLQTFLYFDNDLPFLCRNSPSFVSCYLFMMPAELEFCLLFSLQNRADNQKVWFL